MPAPNRAPRWAAQFLNLILAETAIHLEAVYEFRGVPRPLLGWLPTPGKRPKGPLTPVRVSVKPACCFIELECNAGALTSEARATITRRNLDVLLWCDPYPLRDGAGVARYGLWQVFIEGRRACLVRDGHQELSRVESEKAGDLCAATAQMVVEALVARV